MRRRTPVRSRRSTGPGPVLQERDAIISFDIAAIWAAAEARVWIDVLGGLVRQGEHGGDGPQRMAKGGRRQRPNRPEAARRVEEAAAPVPRGVQQDEERNVHPTRGAARGPGGAQDAAAVLKPITFEQELLSGPWTFGRVNGDKICTITFTKTVGKYGDYVLKARFPTVLLAPRGKHAHLLAQRRDTDQQAHPQERELLGRYLGHKTLPNKDGTIHYVRR